MSLKRNLISFIFISILGTIFHFTYEWSNDNFFVGLFSAVNESTWEHLKLLFFPMLLLTLIQIFLYSDKLPDNFLPSRLCGILSGMTFITVCFYTIWGVFGKPYDFINIALYYVGVIYALWKENKHYKKGTKITDKQSAFILIIISGAFFIFTQFPPNINLFTSP